MNQMSKGVKIAIISTVSVLLIFVVIVALLWYFAGKTEPVAVSPATNHLMGYSDDAPMYGGVVSTNNLQTVYLSDTQQVVEIYVSEGQQIQKGMPLFRYDTTLTDIQLERQRVTMEQAKLNLQQAQKELAEIKKMKPYTPPPTTRPTTAPTTAPLDPVEDLPYFICGNGTEDNPYRYLWRETLSFDTDFLLEHVSEQNPECYIAFEIRERSALGGKLLEMWGLYVMAEYPQRETEPIETNSEEETTEPTEESSQEATEEETEPTETVLPSEEPDPTPVLTYRFFIPEEIDHVQVPVVTTKPTTEWIDTSSGYTAAEIAVMKQEKEREIRDLDLVLRMEKLLYEQMKQEANNGVVSAQISGTVVKLSDGATALATGEPLMQISEGGSYYVTITIGEYDLDRYDIGAIAHITSWMNYGYEVTGSLVSISKEPVQDYFYSSGDGNTNVSAYEAVLVVPPDALLQEGEWVDVSFSSDQAQESGALYLENAYIRDDEGGYYIYKRDETGLLAKTYVQTGAVRWGYTAVLSGLTEEDWIAFPYGKDVKNGAQTFEDSDAVYSDEIFR